MKKIIIGILAIGIIALGVLIFVNSGKDEAVDKGSTNTQENETINGEKKDVHVKLTYMGADITPGKTFKEKSIAAKANKSTLPSCAFEGDDNVYTYDNIEITTNVSGSTETIYSVYFIDETAKTNEGIKIGSTKEDMIKAYGTDFTDDVSLVTYIDEDGKKQINFELEDKIVTGIEYILVLN